jgi:hypothetical protein
MMSGQEAIVCPFCGAPYAGVISHDAVHVKCKYCGGVVLLPSHLSVVPRCPNHPDTIAVGGCVTIVFKVSAKNVFVCSQ